MKSVLVTAGQVYGPLDSNKLVGNRTRGLWAVQFAQFLVVQGHQVTLLLPDTYPKSTLDPRLTVLSHDGFNTYRQMCLQLAPSVDAIVAAAAVVNWIPAQPYEGKMPTKGYNEGDIINIPFILAPHVIDQMKAANPKLTLIGCKMLIDASESELIEAAYDVLLRAKCNAVVANDMGHGLRRKLVVHQDRTVLEFNDNFEDFYACLRGHLEDEHYTTLWKQTDYPVAASGRVFDHIVNKYRDRFVKRSGDSEMVFGALYLPTGDICEGIVSPREKSQMFTGADATLVSNIEGTKITVEGPNKATLNAPLLWRMSKKYPTATAILHLHEQLPGFPTVPYAPPGTVRDNDREIPGPVFNIEGHGFIACLNGYLNISDAFKEW